MHSKQKKSATLSFNYRTTAEREIKKKMFPFMEVNNGSLASTARETRPMFEVYFDKDLAKIFKMRRFGGPTEN